MIKDQKKIWGHGPMDDGETIFGAIPVVFDRKHIFLETG